LQKEVLVPAEVFQFKLHLQLGSEAHATSWQFFKGELASMPWLETGLDLFIVARFYSAFWN